MAELSPAAQAVLEATLPVYDDEYLYVLSMEEHAGKTAAAALRALADQVLPEEPEAKAYSAREMKRRQRQGIRDEILAIAAELEGCN